MERLHIVLASAYLARYPEGGGHWSCFLQHLLGLHALGHDVFWLEILTRANDADDARRIADFGERMDRLGFRGRWAIALTPRGRPHDLRLMDVRGVSNTRLEQIITDADLLWDFASSLRAPLLQQFRRRALIDGDPGIVQVSALAYEHALAEYDVRFTAGLNIGATDCAVPLLGLDWQPFPQFVHLPAWPFAGRPAADARFTSVTQWGWGELHLHGRVLSVSKRDAYMQFLAVPRKSGATIELAANINRADPTGDLPRLAENDWAIVDPSEVARDLDTYRAYIARAKGEFCCPKPIYTELRTGWFSDRSAAYLASGRPVVMVDTGVAGHLPVGAGLLCFHDESAAIHRLRDVEENYAQHSHAARELAIEHLSAARVLPRMLEASGRSREATTPFENEDRAEHARRR